MNKKDILSVAMKQSAEDMGCLASDFTLDENVIKPYSMGKNARKYLSLPITCNMVSYGNNIVCCTTDEVRDIVSEYITKFTYYHCFETPNMHWLNERLVQKGHKICFMAEYFLPDMDRLTNLPCSYEMRILTQKDFTGLYLPEWSNALCEKRKELDVLGVGAYDNGKLIGFAACSADCEDMWQIGIDVLPQYRRNGIASALTSTLATEIIKCGKLPFYCAAWSNIRSVRNALKSGFVPSWIEMTVKPAQIVDDMNK